MVLYFLPKHKLYKNLPWSINILSFNIVDKCSQFSEYPFLLIGFYYIQQFCLSTLNNFIFILIKCYFFLYRLTLTTVFSSYYCAVSSLPNSYFVTLYILLCYLSQVICCKWVSCSKSSDPIKLLQKISENSKENLHYRIQPASSNNAA